MKAATAVLVLVFSFSAHSAKESSAVEQLKSIPPDEAKCEAGKKEYGDWNLKKAPLPKEKVSRSIELLGQIETPEAKDLEVIRSALKEDPAGALPFYFTHSNCGMLRRHLVSKLLQFAELKTATAEDKASIKTALKSSLAGQKYEMFIEAMIDAANLADVYNSKLFTEGKSEKEIAALKKLKTQLTADARATFPEELTKSISQEEDTRKLTPAEHTELLRKSPVYEKYKGSWSQEAEISGRALVQLREFAAKLQ